MSERAFDQRTGMWVMVDLMAVGGGHRWRWSVTTGPYARGYVAWSPSHAAARDAATEHVASLQSLTCSICNATACAHLDEELAFRRGAA